MPQQDQGEYFANQIAIQAQTQKANTDTEKEAQVCGTKQARKDLDEILQNIRKLKGSREVSLTITKVQEAIMWLGMNLKQLNEPNPYPESYNPNSKRIEPTADGLKL